MLNGRRNFPVPIVCGVPYATFVSSPPGVSAKKYSSPAKDAGLPFYFLAATLPPPAFAGAGSTSATKGKNNIRLGDVEYRLRHLNSTTVKPDGRFHRLLFIRAFYL